MPLGAAAGVPRYFLSQALGIGLEECVGDEDAVDARDTGPPYVIQRPAGRPAAPVP